jgi:DNA-binding NarL/FixJ family response regulator
VSDPIAPDRGREVTNTPRQRVTRHALTGYGAGVTRIDDAAIAAAKAEAQAAMQKLTQAEQAANAARAERDAAILKMFNAGRLDADIARDLDIPKSTVRQARRMALVRSTQS